MPTEAVRWLDTAPPAAAGDRSLVLFDRDDELSVHAGEGGIRFLTSAAFSGSVVVAPGGLARRVRSNEGKRSRA